MNASSKQIRIAVTGPESTGKTTLARNLSERFNGQYIPEYAREYVEKLSGHYTFEDVENIAKVQIEQYRATEINSGKLFVFDTWLVITKVWFSWVYGKVPSWLEEQILNCPIDLFLVCKPDLPWEADAVRENGGENRVRLFETYRNELINYGFKFVEIEGVDQVRQANAEEAIRNYCSLV